MAATIETIAKPCKHCGRLYGPDPKWPQNFKRSKMCSMACSKAARKHTPAKAIAAFWTRIDKSGGPDACWPYKGARLPEKVGGYGWANVAGKLMGAHRHAWVLTFGEIPEDKEVCHSCDNGPCCNPAHLFLGTHAENMLDCKAKLRHTHGERNFKAKLTEAQAREVLALKGAISGNRLCRAYGVGPGAIHAIWRGESWKHLQR